MSRPTSTIAADVYDKMRFSIFIAEYVPGDALQEIPLSEHYSVSRSVIRDVLAGLEDDGLVESKPKTSAQVRPVPRPEEIMASQESRFYLESLSGLDLIRFLNAGKVTLDRLEKLHADMRQIAKTQPKDSQKHKANFLILDIDFHLEITRQARRVHFERVLSRLLHSVRLHSLPIYQDYENLSTVVDEHEAIVQGLRDRDPAEFVTSTIAHLDNATARWLSKTNQYLRPVTSQLKELWTAARPKRT